MPHWIFKTIIIAILSGYWTSCKTVGPMNFPLETEELANEIRIDRPLSNEKAVVILLHGLNLKPEKMDDWAEALKSHGAITLRLSLHGHNQSLANIRDVTGEMWREQFKKAVSVAQSLAEDKLPIYFIGFSLGALVGLEWLALDKNPHADQIKKMVLIAPAIATPWYSNAALSMMSLFGNGFMVPSRSPKEYRVNKGSSVAAYKALFELKCSLLEKKFKNANVPTLILIDKYDELIPSKEIKKIIGEHRLGQWALDIIDNRVAYKNQGFRHLMVDKGSCGPGLWENLVKKVLSHLALSS